MKLTRIWIGVLLLGGCTAQTIVMREKVVERNAPPRSAIQVDHFVYGRPYGQVDVVFAVDNTESFESGLGTFATTYRRFLSRWSDPLAHQLDYRVQVVSNPKATSPHNFSGTGGNEAGQLAELFDTVPPASSAPIFSLNTDSDHREHGYLEFLAPTAAALSQEIFSKRARVPVFLIYAFAGDSDPSADDSGNMHAALQKLDAVRGLYQTHAVILSQLTKNGSFPHCNEFAPADRLRAQIGTVAWRSKTEFDLCDSQWGNWDTNVFNQIIDFKKRMVLSSVPKDPETMTLRAGSHLYRYGQDYRWDEATGEIVFVNANALVDGDLVEVAYYLQTIDPPLNGSPVPGDPKH